MKLEVTQSDKVKHSDLATCVGWTTGSELISVADDNQILKWAGDGEPKGKLLDFNSIDGEVKYINTISWCPVTPSKGQAGSDMLAAGASNGYIYMITKIGKIEKQFEAHKGSVLSIEWNNDATAIASGGEDGLIKIWSRSGMLRSVLAQTSYPIYNVKWAPNNQQCLYTQSFNLAIKSLQPSTKPITWKAHDGLILQTDWSIVNNVIVSCGEDKRYRVWDPYGRRLYSSHRFEYPITSIRWSPNGEYFAIGSFNILAVCDKLGWCNALQSKPFGSVLNLHWTPDGTEVAAATGSGSIIFALLVNRRYGWKNYHIQILEENKVLVSNLAQGTDEELEFRDRVIQVKMGFGYLIVTSAHQCYLYNVKNWNTPSIIDLSNNGRVTCIEQCDSYFALVDSFAGVQIYGYDGRLISTPKFPGIRGDFMTSKSLSISQDVVAIKDNNDERTVHIFDTRTGRALGDGPIKHNSEILEISLNNCPNGNESYLAIMDRNRDLFLIDVHKRNKQKLSGVVDSFAWNDENDSFIAVLDGRLVVFYYPPCIFVDSDIAPLAQNHRDASIYGRNPQILSFYGTSCTLRRADGALMSVPGISPYVGVLQKLSKKKEWESAIKLCRHVQHSELWAALAAMSLNSEDLNTAEVAYAAINEAHKVQFINQVREIPTAAGRSAELALLRKQPNEAEAIQLSSNLIYRAIRMWIDLFNWDRALELAVKNKKHVDTVLYYRSKYLKGIGRNEMDTKFLQYSKVPIDVTKIKQNIAKDLEMETASAVRT